MALKGTTKIELTNVKTGEKEVIEKDNLVTNAVGDVVGMNPLGILFRDIGLEYGGYNDSQADYVKWFPVCPNLFGGILLYENALEEDPAKYYAPQENPLVGYSSNDVSPGTDVKRGSMNQTESGPLEDGSGYRFVFDFASSQANGTISSLGLTSKLGGASGYGSEEVNKRIWPIDGRRQLAYGKNYYTGNTNGSALNWAKEFEAMVFTVALDIENNKAISIRLIGDNTIRVTESKVPLSSLLLNYGIMKEPTITNELTLVTTSFGAPKTSGTNDYYYTSFCDGGDGYIWGFQHQNNTEGNSSGDAVINWVKIKKEDYSVEEGTWTFSNIQLYRFGRQAGAYTQYECNFIVHDGFLYCANYDRSGVYMIETDNITNIKFIELSAKYYNNQSYYYGTCMFNVCGDVVILSNQYIVNGENQQVINAGSVNNAYSRDSLACTTYPKLVVGPFIVSCYYCNYNYNIAPYRDISLMTPYLATINNLATPVEKTADKTMKITYILREE